MSSAKQLLIQQVGFMNSRHFFQHRSRAKYWFKNLKILIKFWVCCYTHPKVMTDMLNWLEVPDAFIINDFLQNPQFNTAGKSVAEGSRKTVLYKLLILTSYGMTLPSRVFIVLNFGLLIIQIHPEHIAIRNFYTIIRKFRLATFQDSTSTLAFSSFLRRQAVTQ